jgi:hypothetical protein
MNDSKPEFETIEIELIEYDPPSPEQILADNDLLQVPAAAGGGATMKPPRQLNWLPWVLLGLAILGAVVLAILEGGHL